LNTPATALAVNNDAALGSTALHAEGNLTPKFADETQGPGPRLADQFGFNWYENCGQ